MSQIVIQVENLSKAYQIGQIGSGTISRDIDRLWQMKILGKEDPFLKVGETNDRSIKGDSNIVWSLKDINFQINQGDAVGIIGKNGAGKSTLLKLLSRVTSPTTGSIKVKGRISSLLEVGTGFHPELSGRENIYLNGAILGMRKKEITRKLDEIIDFSGVERYIDTPVKRYSSGMYVRLAFAVAAHLESEILIVDEVLAVGDAEFQKKCLGKMGEISKGEGRTVLFVSHQLGSVASLCNKGMLLNNGKLSAYGTSTEIIEKYLTPISENNDLEKNIYLSDTNLTKNKQFFFIKGETLNSKNQNVDSFGFDEEIKVRLTISVKGDYRTVILGVGIQDKFNNRVCTFINNLNEIIIDNTKETFKIEVTIPKNIIAPNVYNFIFALYEHGSQIHHIVDNVCNIKIHDTGTIYSKYEGIDYGNVIIDSKWEIN